MALALILTSGWFLLNDKAQTPVIEPKTATQTEAQAESVFPIIPNEQIFSISETNFVWAYDVMDTETVLGRATAVARVKVLSSEPASYVYPPAMSPYTPLNVQVLEVMSGNLELGLQTLYFPGGTVTAEQYLKVEPRSSEKMGLTKYSQNERKKMHIKFEQETDYDLKKNTEYIFLLIRDDEVVSGAYFILDGAYSTFTTDKKNVKTGNELKSTKASKAKVAASTPAE
ncbi:MAG: hypothetical protein LBJ12_04840 [Oscillospiraceae bacterium]|nr:hypothetical protein [Oscillospiraceae bacterium]